VEWKPEYGLALIPIGAAIVVSLVVVIFGGSANTAQWAAIIVFFFSLPFVIGRLIDRAK
jgi:Na+/alanine symporter